MAIILRKELFEILLKILRSNGFNNDSAKISANIFTENTLVGVASHGVNRFSSFIKLVELGHIIPNNIPCKVNSFNSFEQWDGNFGPGPNNALMITNEVLELSKKNGIGCIALKNTNHWMRPGYYAWEAANRGCVFICWTNTIPIMPPWGAKSQTIGNNPIVFGVPREEGNIVLDMALSQYSYGKLATYARGNKKLPYNGGYNANNEITNNAKEIYHTHRPLPIGYWKGSGFALLLDLIAAILSGGKSTYDLGKTDIDSGMSQIFIAINPQIFSSSDLINNSVNEILNYYLSAEAIDGEQVSYPGERIVNSRKNNLEKGIQIDDEIWAKIENLLRDK